MREIKFRAIQQLGGEWIYGSLLQNKYGERYILPFEWVERDGHHIVVDSDEPVFISQETVGQYTGLKDKGGKEIYEGDIVSVYCWPIGVDRLGIKVYLDKAVVKIGKYFDFVDLSQTERIGLYLNKIKLHKDQEVNISFMLDSIEKIEVVGNIHENPELLEREKA